MSEPLINSGWPEMNWNWNKLTLLSKEHDSLRAERDELRRRVSELEADCDRLQKYFEVLARIDIAFGCNHTSNGQGPDDADNLARHVNELIDERDQLLTDNVELRKDKERLEWVLGDSGDYWITRVGRDTDEYPPLNSRDAIDAAMAAEKGKL